jgi:3-isopropylmalate/(R)-2-methylmalate dehydratase small subunit
MSYDLNRIIRGRVWKFGDSIDTDSINPYYQYSTLEDLKQHTMESYRPEFAKEVKPGDIIVAGRNFGCGSHRPGGVLRLVGIAAIVAESVARLFLRNTIALPLPIFPARGICGIVDDGEILEIDYANSVSRNPQTGASVALRKFPPMVERIFQCGGLPKLTHQRYMAESGRS